MPNHHAAKPGQARAGSDPAKTGAFCMGLLRYIRMECVSPLMQSIPVEQRGCGPITEMFPVSQLSGGLGIDSSGGQL